MSIEGRLQRDGFALVRAAVPQAVATELASSLCETLQANADAHGIRRSRGHIYATRNLGHLWPEARRAEQWLRAALPLDDVLEASARVVRMLYFDKPPGRSWSLPWHRDTLLAAAPTIPTPTRRVFARAGVPHIHGELEVLARMLTVRLHLDTATKENGALCVVPGSHACTQADLGSAAASSPADTQVVVADPGDALLMRPLLLHKSYDAAPDSARHRRVLHLEFAATEAPAPGFSWIDPYAKPAHHT